MRIGYQLGHAAVETPFTPADAKQLAARLGGKQFQSNIRINEPVIENEFLHNGNLPGIRP